MPTTSEVHIAHALDEIREDLIYHVSELLAVELPMIRLPIDSESSPIVHSSRIAATVRRFHRMIQMGSTVTWDLVPPEYEWTSRVLGNLGVTWDHQLTLIDTYFDVAGRLRAWTTEERVELIELADRVRALGAAVYEQ